MKFHILIKTKMLLNLRIDAIFILLINVKMTIVGILTFMRRINFLLSWVEHEKSFITLGPGSTLFMAATSICINHPSNHGLV